MQVPFVEDDHVVEQISANGLDPAFRGAGLPAFVLGLRSAGGDDLGPDWLNRPHAFRSIGALATDQQFMSLDIRDLYDAIVYFDKTTASRPLPSPGTRLR